MNYCMPHACIMMNHAACAVQDLILYIASKYLHVDREEPMIKRPKPLVDTD